MEYTNPHSRMTFRFPLCAGIFAIAFSLLSLCFAGSAHSQEPQQVSADPMPAEEVPDNEVKVGFRIDVDIYIDESKPPIAQHKTIFTDELAIDLDSERNGAVVMDYVAGILTVLNSRNRTLTSIELADVNAMLKDALAQAPASPDYPVSRDAEGLLIIGDETVEYKVKTDQPAARLLATRYSDFADATTKIAAIFPPYKPPQLRLELNRVLREANELPMVTTRITNANGTKSTVVARMLIKPQLDSEDRKDIEIVTSYLNQFKQLSSREFFGVK